MRVLPAPIVDMIIAFVMMMGSALSTDVIANRRKTVNIHVTATVRASLIHVLKLVKYALLARPVSVSVASCPPRGNRLMLCHAFLVSVHVNGTKRVLSTYVENSTFVKTYALVQQHPRDNHVIRVKMIIASVSKVLVYLCRRLHFRPALLLLHPHVALLARLARDVMHSNVCATRSLLAQHCVKLILANAPCKAHHGTATP